MYKAVTITPRRKNTEDEIENLINLWRCKQALWDSSMEIIQFYLETLVSVGVTFPELCHKQTVGTIL